MSVVSPTLNSLPTNNSFTSLPPSQEVRIATPKEEAEIKVDPNIDTQIPQGKILEIVPLQRDQIF